MSNAYWAAIRRCIIVALQGTSRHTDTAANRWALATAVVMVTRVAWGATVTTVSVSSSVALLAGSMPNPTALGPLGVAVCNA